MSLGKWQLSIILVTHHIHIPGMNTSIFLKQTIISYMAMVLSGTIWKGSCDGVGGTVNMLADQASLHGTEIVDMDSMFLWATTINNPIHFSFVMVDEFELADEDI